MTILILEVPFIFLIEFISVYNTGWKACPYILSYWMIISSRLLSLIFSWLTIPYEADKAGVFYLREL